MKSDLFRIGDIYARKALHAQFGGQRQGGISTPRNWPFVFLFTGITGERYGYYDMETPDDTFLYTGEGQAGDMQFTKGNAAIRNSISHGKDLHLFKYVGKGKVEYIGQMLCQGYQVKEGPDVNSHVRKVIVFELLPVERALVPPYTQLSSLEFTASLEELREKALAEASEQTDTNTRQVAIRERSKAIRAYVLRRANGICEGCNKPAPFNTPAGLPFLEPHHIRKLSDGGPDDPVWVAALCPNCHAKAHYGAESDKFNVLLTATVSRKESRQSRPIVANIQSLHKCPKFARSA